MIFRQMNKIQFFIRARVLNYTRARFLNNKNTEKSLKPELKEPKFDQITHTGQVKIIFLSIVC